MRARPLLFLTLLLAILPLPCVAESPSARVAFLAVGPSSNPMAEMTSRSFAEGLQALGWGEGKNLTTSRRYSEGNDERAAAFAAELIAEKPDVIVAVTYQNARAAQQATETIPIVFVNVPDPVGLGLVASLARPGGNITGISDQTQDLVAKSLQLLKETRARINRVAYLGFGEPSYWQQTVEITGRAARQLGLTMTMLPIKAAMDFDPALAQIQAESCDALAVSALPLFRANLPKISGFAIEHRLPTLSFTAPMAREGLLLALGPDILAAYPPAAVIVDKILRGAKPADIPVQQPTKFHFVVNLKTAQAIGLEVPRVLLANADEVIE